MTGAAIEKWLKPCWFAVLVILLIATVALLCVRVDSIVREGELSETSGCEAVSIYNIWKLRHGSPLYERPDRDPFCLTAFNAGFYYVYAKCLDVLRVSDAGSILATRLMTLVAGVLGAAGQVVLVRRLCARFTRLDRFVAVALLTACWFGGVVGWWALTARPDVAGVACETWALAILVKHARRLSTARLVSAGALFAAAWLFKQSLVSMLLGCCVLLLIRREIRSMLLLLAPLALVTAGALLIGGDAYRFNLIGVQRDFPFVWRAGPIHMAGALLIGAWYWLVPVIVAISGSSALAWPERDSEIPRVSMGAKLVASAAVVSFVFAIVGMCKAGADRNYAFESLVAAGSLAIAATVNLRDAPRGASLRVSAIAFLLLVGLAAYPVLVLCGVSLAGRAQLLTASERADATAVKALAGGAPKPLFTSRRMLALPWIASENRYPAFVLDDSYVRLPGVIRRAGSLPMSGQIAAHAFSSLLVNPTDPLYSIARAAGYMQASDSRSAIVLLVLPDRKSDRDGVKSTR